MHTNTFDSHTPEGSQRVAEAVQVKEGSHALVLNMQGTSKTSLRRSISLSKAEKTKTVQGEHSDAIL